MTVFISKTEALTLTDTIGTMLSAIVDAQAQSARTTVDFINDVGFQQKIDNQPEILRNIRFNYYKLDENQTRTEFTVEIPLLGLVDIPLICIKKATLSFDYEIVESLSSEDSATEDDKEKKIFGRIKKPAVIKGRLLDKSVKTSESTRLSILIELEKADIPIGLNRVLDILQTASSEKKVVTNGG